MPIQADSDSLDPALAWLPSFLEVSANQLAALDLLGHHITQAESLYGAHVVSTRNSPSNCACGQHLVNWSFYKGRIEMKPPSHLGGGFFSRFSAGLFLAYVCPSGSSKNVPRRKSVKTFLFIFFFPNTLLKIDSRIIQRRRGCAGV